MSVHCCSVILIRHFAVEASSVDHVLTWIATTKSTIAQHVTRLNYPHFMTKVWSEPSTNLKVQCIHEKRGCTWTGELGELDQAPKHEPNM